MKTSIIFTTCALICGASIAQTAADNMGADSGKAPMAAGMKSDMKPEMKKGMDGAMPMTSDSSSTMGMGSMDMKTMDENGDGMISKKEWMNHRTMMWSKMKTTKGMVSMADMQSNMQSGMPMASGSGSMEMASMGLKAMDANGDGMVSKKEWTNHQTRVWAKMKTKKGMMPIADMESMAKTGIF